MHQKKMNCQAKISMANSQQNIITITTRSSSWFIFILVYLFCTINAPVVHTFVPYNSNNNNNYKNNKDNQSTSSQLHQQNEIQIQQPLSNNIINNKNYNNNRTIILESINVSSSSTTTYYKGAGGALIIYPINDLCNVDISLTKVLCQGLRRPKDLPQKKPYFDSVEYAEFVNVSQRANLSLEHLHNLFPNLVHLSINHSPDSLPSIIERLINSSSKVKRELFKRNAPATNGVGNSGFTTAHNVNQVFINYDFNSVNGNFIWDSIRYLNLSWNELTSHVVTNSLLEIFPNIEVLDVSHNFLSELNISVEQLPYLKFMDISGNPLDCTSDLYWLEDHNIELLHPEQTLCDLPPHQNKAKPIWKVIRLIKKVREECKVNCTCDIAYIWEQNHVIHSKTSVNCSNRGFRDFPDPDKLPHPTDTLDLSNNEITSIKKFVEDERYADLFVMNLYLDSNRVSSINLLEGSEWFYNFQVFTIRNNSITEVPVYVLENVFRQNKRILQIDLSMNDFNCECITVSTLKIWLLRYSSNIKHIDEVQCTKTKEPIRYMKREDWCTIEYSEGEVLVDVLDILSIFLALAILLVIGKVYYDYWNFKTNGKLPWIVRKM